MRLSAETVISMSATVIAVVALAVSIYEARASRKHNRHSVRPVLQLWLGYSDGKESGLLIVNSGLGPALITKTMATVDGVPVGPWIKPNVDTIREPLPFDASATTFAAGAFLKTDYQALLLGVDEFAWDEHGELISLIDQRLKLEVQYESLYGGEQFKAIWTPTHTNPPPERT